MDHQRGPFALTFIVNCVHYYCRVEVTVFRLSISSNDFKMQFLNVNFKRSGPMDPMDEITKSYDRLVLSATMLLLLMSWVFLAISTIPLSLSLSIANSNLASSRLEFLSSATSSTVLTSLTIGYYYYSEKQDTAASLVLPLQFLPRAGCLAVRINVNDKTGMQRLFSYLAVIDTGSPFCTAPPTILPFSKDESQRYPPTLEQYGEAIGSMKWRSITNGVQILTDSYVKPLDITGKMFVGIPDDNVVDDTGGIFLGLMLQDKYRPTVLNQWGYSSFVLDYRNQTLKLAGKKANMILDKNDPNAMELFDLTPFGDNVHHYGVQCTCFSLQSSASKESFTVSSLNRPVIAVIDSGLTGCVFSDSLRDELMTIMVKNKNKDYNGNANFWEQVAGMTVSLSTISGKVLTLSSNPAYWSLSAFKLPWFYNDQTTHPHVIAVGATFLASSTRISLDPLARRIKIESA